MRKILFILCISLSVGLFAEPQNGVVYVKSGGTGSGTSWTDAMGDIQAAISAAKSDDALRKDVWVAAGEYTITSSISMIDSINVYGGFAGTETALEERLLENGGKPWEFKHPTILKGDGARLVQTASNFDMKTAFDGFTLTNGNATGSSLNGSGGAAVVRANMVIENCIIKNSMAENGAGGAVIMTAGTIKNSLIYNNKQLSNANGGGGLFINTAGGQETVVENCVLQKNSSDVRGGAINVQGKGFTQLNNLYILNNQAIKAGGLKAGGAIYGNSPNYKVTNSVIFNNTGQTALYVKGSVVNSTIVNNVGGVYIADATATIEFSNNIVWGCITETGGTSATGLSGRDNPNITAHNNATYNPIPEDKGWNIADNILFSSNNSNGDVENPADGTVGSGPKFVKVSRFKGAALADEEELMLDTVNWRINDRSPCLNSGKTISEVLTDFVYTPRPQGFPTEGAKYDIGAYESIYYAITIGSQSNTNGAIYDETATQLPDGSAISYPEGASREFLFQPEAGYEIGRAYYTIKNNGTKTAEEVDITEELSELGIWQSVPLHNAIELFAVWREKGAGLENLDAYYQVYANNQQINIAGVTCNDYIRIFTLTGKMVINKKATTQTLSIPMERGIYVIQINDKSKKIVVE